MVPVRDARLVEQFRDEANALEAKTLGLRIVYILAKRLNATVIVENRNGAWFTITFPLHADAPVEPRSE